MLQLVGCLYYLGQWGTAKQISDNEIYLLIKYIKSVLWRVAKRLSYIEDARCLKLKRKSQHLLWNLRPLFFLFIFLTGHFRSFRRIAKNRRLEPLVFPSAYLSVYPSAWKNSAPNETIFMKFFIWVFFENLSRKFKIYYNQTKITGSLYEDQCTFLIISSSFLLRMRNIST